MRYRSQWKQLLILIIFLTALNIFKVDEELKPSPDVSYATTQEKTEAPKFLWSPDGQRIMSVNSCQNYSFVAYTFLFLMIAQNLVQLRTPMMLTRYAGYRTFRKKVFLNLFPFSAVFIAVSTGLLLLAELTAPLTGLGDHLFVVIQFYPAPFAGYVLHMLLCAAMLCLYQSIVLPARRYLLAQLLPMAYLMAFAAMQSSPVSRFSPFSFALYDRMSGSELAAMFAIYAVCFGILIVFARRPWKECFAEAKE